MNIYYVYHYLREDGTPYYVGKGKGTRAFAKHHGRRAPDQSRVKFIADNLPEQEAFELEIQEIAKYGRKDNGTGILHNLTDGGNGTSGFTMSEESRAKLSAAKTGIGLGRAVSAETRHKLSIARKGKVFSDDWRLKLSHAKKGRKCTERQLAALSKGRLGRVDTAETTAKRSASRVGKGLGKVHSAETRAKISAANKGRVFTEEHRARISAAKSAM